MPEQEVNLLIDTSSAYIWVKSPGCNCHDSDHSFDVGESSTYQSYHIELNLTYGNSIVSGILGSDVVELGHHDSLSASFQTLLVIDYDYGFDNMTSDGIIGFGLSQLSQGIPSFMENLKNQSQIAKILFSLYLNDDYFDDNKHPEPSSMLIIGGVNTDYAEKENSPVVNLKADLSKGYWQVQLGGVYFGTVKMNITSKSAIFDSRHSCIAGPEADIKNVRRFLYNKYSYCNYDNQGQIICDCDDVRDFPEFEFQLSSSKEKILLKPKYYFHKEGKKCLLLLIVDNSVPFSWHLGSPFLRSYYSVYDGEEGVISLYPSKVSKDKSESDKESARIIIIFFVVLLIVICIIMSVFLYLFCCRHRMNFDEHYKPLFTAKYSLPPHYHRTAVKTATGEVVPDYTPTSRQNRVFPGIASK